MQNYSWPGNVRELQNAVRQGILKTTGRVLLPDFLPDFVRKSPSGHGPSIGDGEGASNDLGRTIEEKIESGTESLYDEVIGYVENQLVNRVLKLTDGDKHEAIKRLGVNPAVLRSPAALDLLDAIEKANGHASTIRPGMTMEQIERVAIRQALEESRGSRKEAAEMLGISVRTMQRKIKEHRLVV